MPILSIRHEIMMEAFIITHILLIINFTIGIIQTKAVMSLKHKGVKGVEKLGKETFMMNRKRRE